MKIFYSFEGSQFVQDGSLIVAGSFEGTLELGLHFKWSTEVKEPIVEEILIAETVVRELIGTKAKVTELE